MAGQFTLYNSGHLGFFDGSFNFAADNVQAILLADTYTPAATHATLADISGNEITDTDYARQTVANASVTDSSGTVTVTADAIEFGTAVTISAKYCALFQQASTSAASTDKLIGYVDLAPSGGSVASTNSEYKVTIPSGLFTDAVA